MLPKSIKRTHCEITNSAIEFVRWPEDSSIDKKHIDEKILAIQTTRVTPSILSGDKTSPYQGFNLGLHVGDCSEQVRSNRNYLQGVLPQHAKIQWFEQVHANEVAEVSQVSEKAVVADAAVTCEKNICLAIMTADCLPILLMSKSGGEVAAIHGGWRPLCANIIMNTLDKMKTPAADIVAWLGPCISKSSFEVGSEVKTSFVQQNECLISAFTEKSNGKYFADLHKIATIQLEKLGVSHISALPECTYSNTNKYYSYRKNATTGRMATLICLL